MSPVMSNRKLLILTMVLNGHFVGLGMVWREVPWLVHYRGITNRVNTR
jgi:hypothetical protein